jgi:hypothetical protein
MNENVVILAVSGGVLLIGLYLAGKANLYRSRNGAISAHSDTKDLVATINTLRRQLDESDQRHASEKQALDMRVLVLENENNALVQRVAKLESDLAQFTRRLPAKPLLVISGGDNVIFERDRVALRRANVPFHRILNATQADIRAELRRRRQDDSLYIWVLISAHAGPEGIMLRDGIAPPAFWHDVLTDIKVVVLATCASSTTADELAGQATVIWFGEEIDNGLAADFSYALWRRMYAAGSDPKLSVNAAYIEALREVPTVAEFVDIRRT